MTDDLQRIKRVTLLWRLAFVGYALMLFIATHWPQLDLGDDGPSDKSIHLYVFGLMPILLWQTRWISRLSVVYLISLLWCSLDEWSQGLPFLGRHMTWQDLAANYLGITLAVTWIWALRPIGGKGNRLRLDRHRYVVEEIFASPKAWFIFVGLFLGCAAPIVLLWPILKPVGIQGPLGFAVIIWGMVSGIVWSNVWRKQSDSTIQFKECFACGASCQDLSFDELGLSTCAQCGKGVHSGQWLEHARPKLPSLMKFAIGPVLIGIGIVVLAMCGIFLSGIIYDWCLTNDVMADLLIRMLRSIGTEKALMNAVDFSAVFMVLAIITYLFRRRLARFYDKPFRCLKCGHDLRGTPTSEGLGRCGECGFLFSRAPELKGAGLSSQ